MESLPLHPKIVHLPIALAMLMPFVSLGLLAAWWRGWLPRRAWMVVVLLQVVLVGSGLASIRSGRAEEERVERVVPRGEVHEHEEAAEAFEWGGAVVLALVLGAAVLRPERGARLLAAAAFAGTLVVMALAFRAGEAGGALVYRHGAASAYGAAGTASDDGPGDRDDR